MSRCVWLALLKLLKIHLTARFNCVTKTLELRMSTITKRQVASYDTKIRELLHLMGLWTSWNDRSLALARTSMTETVSICLMTFNYQTGPAREFLYTFQCPLNRVLDFVGICGKVRGLGVTLRHFQWLQGDRALDRKHFFTSG